MQVRVIPLACLLALSQVSAPQAWAQDVPTSRIIGVVCDDRGRPLDFANIVLLGTTMGAMARDGGKFTIAQVPVGHYRIKASFVGFEQQVREIYVQPNATTTISFCGQELDAPKIRTIKGLAPREAGELRVVDDDGTALSGLPLRQTSIHATYRASIQHASGHSPSIDSDRR